MSETTQPRTRKIQAPTPGKIILVDADGHTVPALVHRVVDRDLVAFVAHESGGAVLRALGGGLPVARFGETHPGVPAMDCWCYPARCDLEIDVPDTSDTL